MLVIDGSMGEGGGQILRSALALSLITGRSFQLTNIRAKRDKPGLRLQHLTAVKAAAEIGSAEVQGASVGSGELVFKPGDVSPAEYHFDIGSAGSTSLVLQTVLPPLIVAQGPSRLVLEGGTHNTHAPPLDFLQKAFLPLLAQMGCSVEIDVERRGFYPAGGGRFSVSIKPAPKLAPLTLLNRGEILKREARAIVAHLPRHIGHRELKAVEELLDWPPEWMILDIASDVIGPGNILLIEIASEQVTEVFTGFGRLGVRAEDVAAEACAEAESYLASDVPVGVHLADQLLLPMALAGGGEFRTFPVSQHFTTNSQVIGMFLDVDIDASYSGNASCDVTVKQR